VAGEVERRGKIENRTPARGKAEIRDGKNEKREAL
jgi:hypothetical protein